MWITKQVGGGVPSPMRGGSGAGGHSLVSAH